MNILAQKKCTECKKIKEISEFYNSKKSIDGKRHLCQECDRKRNKSYYHKHRESEILRAIKWNKEHPDVSKKAIDRWHKAHPEKANEANRKSRAKYPEKQKEKTRKQRRLHPEISQACTENRRANKLKSGGKITAKEWRDVLKKYNHICLDCGRTDVRLTQDHVVPLSMGGTHTIDNIQPLCGSCNSKKNTKIIDFRPRPNET